MENYTKSSYGDFYLYTGDMGDTIILEDIRKNGSFADYMCDWILDNVKPGWICYDIGANIGQMSYVMAIAAKANGAVYAFEPQERLVNAFNYGKQLTQLVDTAEIYMYPIGLSNAKQESNIKALGWNLGGATLSPEVIDVIREENYEHHTFPVKVDRLDNLNLPSPDFIKIDIEGHEAKAWLGFTQEAKECPLILAEIGTYTEHWLLEEYISYGRKAYNLSGDALDNTVEGLLQYLHSTPYQQVDIIFRRD